MEPSTHNIELLPVEVLGQVFNQLTASVLQSCRLVCHSWNQEIIAQQSLSILLRDIGSKNGNLEFIRSVNVPRCLKVGVVREKSCEKLKLHSLSQLNTLVFSLINSPLGFNTSIKFFNDHCHRLTCLEFTGKTLQKCDFEKEFAATIQQYSLFLNISKLVIMNLEDHQSACCGKEIQKISKNIQFLLQHIGTTKLVHFTLQINESYMDINCCTGRGNYHFEDLILPKFISRQPFLQELCIRAPASMPNQPWASNAFPNDLKTMIIESRSGDLLGGLHAFRHPSEQRFKDKELLGWNPLYYNNVEDSDKCSFWKSLILAQKSMESIYFLNSFHMGDARFLTDLAQNNTRSLRRIIISSKISSIIDGRLFMSCGGLEELSISNKEVDAEDCSFINIKCLSSLKEFALRNVSLDSSELETIPVHCHSLVAIQLHYTIGHSSMLENKTNFELIFKKMLKMRNLERLSLGQFASPKLADVPPYLLNIKNILKNIMQIENLPEDEMSFDINSHTMHKVNKLIEASVIF